MVFSNAESQMMSQIWFGAWNDRPANRANRVLEPWQEMAEIKALPKTFDSACSDVDRSCRSVDDSRCAAVARETEADRA